MVNTPEKQTKLVQSQSKSTKMVKMKAHRDIAIVVGKTEDGKNQKLRVKAGNVFECTEETAKELERAFKTQYSQEAMGYGSTVQIPRHHIVRATRL